MATGLGLLGIGWYVALCLLVGVLGGLWLDSRLGLSPLFILLGVGAGLVVAGFGTYRMLLGVLSQGENPGDKSRR